MYEKSKVHHGLVVSDLNKSETMSFSTAEKCSSDRVICTERKTIEKNQGTILYLNLIQSIIKAYIRIWKECMLHAKMN